MTETKEIASEQNVEDTLSVTDTKTTEEKKPVWSNSQLAAINLRDKTVLVSAAAGSGKTTTLTERIIRSLTDEKNPSDISKMLIVTFTKASATDLKEKIFEALSKELAKNPASEHLNEQLIKLGSANISTIDSFYLNLIKQNFSALNVSASFRIADNAEIDILKKRVMDEVVDKNYDADERFPKLAECFVGTRSINMLSKELIELYDQLMSYREGVDFLKKNAEYLYKCAEDGTDFFATDYGKIAKDQLIAQFTYYSRFHQIAYDYLMTIPDNFRNRAETYKSDLEYVETVLGLLSKDDITLDEIRPTLLGFSPENMKSATPRTFSTPESVYLTEQRTKYVTEVRAVRDIIFTRDSAAVSLEFKRTAEHIEKLYSLLSEFREKLTEEKTRRNVMDFDDIRRHTYRLLVNEDGTFTEIAQRYRKQFTDIYIDEYQDVDRVQDTIFRALSNNNRFMVGDIKQSIYGFRGADPQVFAEYKKSFFPCDVNNIDAIPLGANEVNVFMSENYRCTSNIIEFTNLVCSRIFNSCKESIGYIPDDDLRLPESKAGMESDTVDVSVIISKYDDDEDDDENEDSGKSKKKKKIKKKKKKKDDDIPSNEELEAEHIASKIHEILEEAKQKEEEDRRNGKEIKKGLRPGDIAILYRSAKMAPYLVEALGKRDILCSEGGGESYFEEPDVLLVLSLLNVVDNPHRDIHLAGTLHSPLFEFSMDDLITIKLNGAHASSLYDALVEYSEKDDELASRCRSFNETLTELRRNAIALPIDRFLRILFESDVFAASGLLADRNKFGDGGNLLRLYEYARTFESGSFKGLYNFIEFINTLIENDQEIETVAKAKCEERVNLSTMHHSKGLQFPVCFVCGIGKSKNTKGLHKSLLCEYPEGTALKLSDSTGFSRLNTPLRHAIQQKKKISEIEEEMRILYVAMTRAQNKLYITGTVKSDEKSLLLAADMRNKIGNEHALKSCNKFIDWVMLPFADPTVNSKSATLSFVYPEEIFPDIKKEAEEKAKEEGTETVTVTEVPVEKPKIEPNEGLYLQLKDKFNFKYAYSDLLRLPSKLSVSRLQPDFLDIDDSAKKLFDENKKTHVPDFFITGKPSSASPAEIGTATHLFLQFCDFNNMRKNGIEQEKIRLSSAGKKFIPDDILNLVKTDELEGFIKSELADRISKASMIYREQRFNLLLPATAFTKNSEFLDIVQDESLAVQGVIDLILVDGDGNIELYDYKTDRLSHEELQDDAKGRARMNRDHGNQLSYYAKAVEELFGKPCSKICIYSTHSAKLYDIDPVALSIPE